MKTLKFVPPDHLREPYFRWASDVAHIVRVCNAKGYNISKADAKAAWESHSDGYAASWLILGDDDSIFADVLKQCAVVTGEDNVD